MAIVGKITLDTTEARESADILIEKIEYIKSALSKLTDETKESEDAMRRFIAACRDMKADIE